MTARLDVTLKTTEQNRIVRTGKSKAEVTNNKKVCSRCCIIEAIKLTTDRHEASSGLSASAELLVFFVTLWNNEVCDNGNAMKKYNFQNNYGAIA